MIHGVEKLVLVNEIADKEVNETKCEDQCARRKNTVDDA